MLFDSHAGLVYHAALRTGRGDCHLAEDVVQTVFTSLARKASTFSPRIILPAWLHRHACLTTQQMMRSARRRQTREEASTLLQRQNIDSHSGYSADLIDAALNSLPEADRAALVLRFLENKDLRSVGRELGVSEDAAQKRVSRGLDRLRAALERRGMKKVSTSMAGALLPGPASAVTPSLSHLAAASLRLASATTATSAVGAASIAFLTMKTSTTITASILAVLAGTAAFIMMPKGKPSPVTTAAKEPASIKKLAVTKTPPHLEISTAKGPRFPRASNPSTPAPEYDAATEEAFKNHPMKKVFENKINAMRYVIMALMKKMKVDIKSKQALYQELQANTTNPKLGDVEKTTAKAQLETLSVEIKQMEKELADYEKGVQEMFNRNVMDFRARILTEIKNPSSPAPQPTPKETTSFNSAEALFNKGEYAAAENAFTALTTSIAPQVATFSQWKVMLTRTLQGKDNSNEIQPLLQGSVSSACYAMAAYALQQGGWEEANLWIAKASESGDRGENDIFNDPLIDIGWLDRETGLLIPHDLTKSAAGQGK
jgi:RNA polymerase sigma factor (sigma-70 family)